jgi:hypothetical protein
MLRLSMMPLALLCCSLIRSFTAWVLECFVAGMLASMLLLALLPLASTPMIPCSSLERFPFDDADSFDARSSLGNFHA